MTRMRTGVLAAVSALALSIAAVAPAQRAQPAAAPPTEAQIAASPAAKRLKELLEVLNSGDSAAMLAYVRANSVDATKPPPGPPGALPLLGGVLDLHRRSAGFDLVRVATVDDSGAVAVVHNKLTGDEQALSVKIEPQAPHRITGATILLASAGAYLSPPPVVAQSEQAQLQQIGSYLERLGNADVFSGVVVIARDGKPVLSQAYGYADRDKKIANTVDTLFLLGSMNKLFTGLAIGQLVEQGKLSYEDPLSKFVPDFPDSESAKRIKIKHLLSHTSGLGSYWTPAFFSSLDRLRTVQSILDVADKDAPEFEPGTSWRYSNTGFQLLGRVIEVVTGEDYYEYMRKNVFAPAGVTNDLFPNYDRDGVKMAHPYEIEFEGERLHYTNEAATSPRRGGPAGGGVASAIDLIKLDNAIRAGLLVKPDTWRLHASPKPELGSPQYGYGVSIGARMAKRPLLGHGGNAPGQCTEFGPLTDTPYTIVILSNATMNTCMYVAGKVLQVLAPTKAPAT